METLLNKKLEAVELIKKLYLEHCPNGFFADRKVCLGNDRHIYIGMIADIKDCSNGIRENDIGYGIFTIGENNEGLTLEKSYHNLSCVPLESYYAMSHKKISYRIIKADNPKKLAEKFNIYLSRFFSMVLDQVELKNVYNQNTINPIYLNVR